MSPIRLLVLGGLGLTLVAAAVACTGGDGIVYASNTAGDAGADAGDSGRIVTDSNAPPTRVPIDDGGTLPTRGTHIGCSALGIDDGGCDPSAGLGCCLPSASAGSGSNECVEQIQYFTEEPAICAAAGDVFLACLSSDPDSNCCWDTIGGRVSTRYRAHCDGGLEACDPAGPDGGFNGGPGLCNNGLNCEKATCKGVVVGACGAAPPCTP